MPEDFLGLGMDTQNLSKNPTTNDIERGVDTTSFLGLGMDEQYAPEDIGDYFPGNKMSRYDKYTTKGDLENINQERALMQPWYVQAGSGVIKGIGLAATTFLTPFTSLPLGIAKAFGSGELNKIYDNEISNKFDEFNKWMEEVFPNYYTEEEQNAGAFSPKNWFTMNFLADKLLKNTGFTVGAILSGGVIAKSLQGLGKLSMGAKYGEELGKVQSLAAEYVAQGMNAAKAFTEAVNKVGGAIKLTNRVSQQGALLASAGAEASMEALGAKQQTMKQLVGDFVASHGYEPTEADIDKMEDYASAAGNLTFGANMGILYGSDAVQFGKYLKGFKDERKALGKIIEESPDVFKSVDKVGLLDKIKPFKGFITEAGEEGSQTFTSATTQDYFARNYVQEKGDYTSKKYDEKAYGKTVGAIDSIVKGLEHTFGSKEGLESMLLGALTGGISSVVTGKARGSLQEAKDRVKATEIVAANLTDIFNNDNFKSTVRGQSIINDMDLALVKGDKFEYLNSKHDLLKNAVQGAIEGDKYDALLDKVTRLQDMPQEEFNEYMGLPKENTKTPQEYVVDLTTQIKELKKTKDTSDERFSTYSPEVKEKAFDIITNIQNRSKRLQEVQSELFKAGIPELTMVVTNFVNQDAEQRVETTKEINKLIKENTVKFAEANILDPVQLTRDIIQLAKDRQEYAKEYEKLLTPSGVTEAQTVINKVKEKFEEHKEQVKKDNVTKDNAKAKEARVQDTREKVTPKEEVIEPTGQVEEQVTGQVEPVQQNEVFIDNEQKEPVNTPEEGKVIDPLTAAKQQIENNRQAELNNITIPGVTVEDPGFVEELQAEINAKYDAQLKELEEYSTEETISEILTDPNQYDYDKYKEVVESDNDTQQQLDEVNAEKEVDGKGNISYDYRRSRNGHNLAAYLQRLFKQTWNGLVIKREDVDNALNPDFHKQVLDYNKYNAGTEVNITIDDRDEIPVYIPGTATKEITTWGALKSSVNYNEYVPLVVKDNEGNVLFYLHATDWIKEENVLGDIELDKTQLKKVRDYIISKGEYKTTILERGNGDLFRVKKGSPLVSVSEAMEDPNLVIGVGIDDNGGIKTSKDSIVEGEIHIKHTKPGITYAVVNLNKNFTTALPIYNEKISDSTIKDKVINSITAAISVYIKRDNLTPELQQVKDAVKEFNLTDIDGLESYLKQFINLYNTGKGTLKSLMKETSFTKGKPDTKHLVTIKNRTIEFTSKGAAYNIQDNAQFDLNINNLKDTLSKMYFAVNAELLGLNKPVTYFNFDLEGVTNTETINYKDFVKQHTKTNVLSFEVNPGVYIYTVHPKIRLDFSEILQEEIGDGQQEAFETFERRVGEEMLEVVEPTITKLSIEELNSILYHNNLRAELFPDLKTLHTNSARLKGFGIASDKASIYLLKNILIEAHNNKSEVITDIDEIEGLVEKALLYIEKEDYNKATQFGEMALSKLHDDFSREIVRRIKNNLLKLPTTFYYPVIKSSAIEIKKQYKADPNGFEFNSYSPATITPLEQSARKYIIRELGFVKQEQLTNFLTREIVKELVKGNTGINPSEIYTKFKTKFESSLATMEENITLAKESNDEVNLTKFEAIKQMLEPIVSNWSLIEKFSSYKLARINNIRFDFNDDIDLELDGYEESERNNWDSHQATVDPQKSMSKDIKLFLSDINRLTIDGKIKPTFFGAPDVMDYNEVYNNLQSITANLKPNLDVILAAMESNAAVQPWLNAVADKLRKVDTITRNKFIRVMTNHSRQMDSVIFGRDPKTGNFSYKFIDANANAKITLIQENWLYRAEANNKLTYLDEDGYYKLIEGEDSLKTKFVNRFDELKSRPELRTTKNILDWLDIIGIELSPLAANDLRDKKVRGLTFAEQFTGKGIFINLRNAVQTWGDAPLEGEGSLYKDTSVQDLAMVESYYNLQTHSNSYRSGGKQVYSYGKNTYAVNRVRDLKSDKTLQDNLSQLAFSKHSIWLKNLKEGSLADNFAISVVSLDAFNEFGSKNHDNKELHNQTPANIERAKIGFLQASQRDYSGNKIAKRIITLLYPTTSDKTTPYKIRTEAVKIGYNTDGTITDTFIKDVLYSQLVLPEIERISLFEKLRETDRISELNHAEYEKAGFKFMLLPEINNVPGVFIDGKLNPDISTDSIVQEAIYAKIREYVESIVDYKLENWTKFNIGKDLKDATGKVTTRRNYLDNNFIKENLKKIVDEDALVKAAATDMVIQYLVGNANVFMTVVGDPAQFYKSKSTDSVIQSEDTFINIGKRLAGDIAPRDESSASYNNTYVQAVAADKNSQSLVLKQLKELIGDKANKYESFDGTDAQEITTLLERLYLMNVYGEINGQSLPDGFYDVVAPIIQREINNSNHYYDAAVIEELTKVNPEWVDAYKNLVFQPTKPIYQENIADLSLGIERRIYIKSSDYPLVPSATKGFEIDKLRIQMEKAGISRLAFKTAVKVGSVKTPTTIFNTDGTIIDKIDWTNSTLVLPRSGFGYQQEVPYDPAKKAINRVSQASKNLFNNILSVKDFDYKGRKVDGFELQKIYHDLYDKLFKLQKDELMGRLTTPEGFNIKELKELLKEEIQKRDYPISDADALDLDEALTFMAYSPAADKYESLLNSIVQNKIIKTEFAGKSFVVASEEGWQVQSGKSVSETGIVFTKNFTGKLQPNQAIIPFKFRDNDGNLLHLEDYVVDGFLDTNKLPSDILNVLVMRIPNQGLNSQRAIEIVGFLPHSSGDTIICSRDLVVQMGQDFDVDKLYTYMYNTYLSKDGKLSKESKDNKKILQNEILDIHLAIHNNQDSRVQKQIVEPLGFWLLPEISKFVSGNRLKRFAKSLKFTGLSDEYQKQKFINATAGKSGVGVFSVDSTFNAIAQGKNLLLTSENKPVTMVIGDEVFEGDLSSELGLDGKTFKSDIIAGFQSAAVDNEKEQILDKLNINTYTFKAYKFFNQAGFTNGTLLVSQDIIFDYVDEIARLKSDGFTPRVEEVAYKNILAKYAISEVEVKNEELTEAKLKDMIENGSASENYNNYQKLVLDLFREADAHGQTIQTLQSAINTDSKGLDKNLFGTIVKSQQVSLILNSQIKNATSLLGEFNKEGELVKPTTINGQAIYYGLYTNNELWNRFFPYQQNYLSKMLTRSEQIFGTEEKATGKRADFQRKVWNAFKSYLYSNIEFGLTTNVDSERQRLFYGDNNIGNRLLDLQAQDKYANHPLISRIQVQPGEPVVLKFNAASKENSSDINVYVSFIDLLQQAETKEFAKDLVIAAYISGGIQEAIQYIKYIPVSYLHELPFSDKLAATVEQRLFDANKYINMIADTNAPYWMLPNFLVQFAQHNPGRITQLTQPSQWNVIEGERKTLESVKTIYVTDSSLNTFRNGKPVPSEFLTIYDSYRKRGVNKNHLYQFTGEYKTINDKSYPVYNKLDNLGTFGYAEYNSNLVEGTKQVRMTLPETKANPVASVENKQTETFVVTPGGKKELLDSIQEISINSTDPYFKLLSQELIDNKDRIPNLKLELNPKEEAYEGRWNPTTNTLSLGKVPSKYKLEEAILHETFHSIGDKVINLFLSNKKQLIAEKNPELLRALESLNTQMNDYIKHLWKVDAVAYKEYKRKQYGIKEALKKGVVPEEQLTPEEKTKFYATEGLKEWFTMSSSNAGFQKILHNTYKDNSDRTWYEDFFDKFIKLFKALGFNFDKNTVLATAIDDILFIVKQEPIVESTNENKVENYSMINPIKFEEFNISGYRERTIKNASADVTLAFALDFETAGEKLTKSSVNNQGKLYIPINVNNSEITDERINKIVNEINSKIKKESDLFGKPNISINIAGNGIYTLKNKFTQESVDNLMYNFLNAIINHPNFRFNVELIRSGGQTGFDEAGIKAGNKLGINTLVLAPKGWAFRNVQSKDIYNEEQFKNRFLSQGEIIESLSPMTNIPSANEILKQANELNSDGTKKKLAVTNDNYKVMIKRAQKVNFMQPYYKATVKETFGEGVGYKSKKFFYIDMELRNFDNFAERVKLISDKEVQERIKYCKGR